MPLARAHRRSHWHFIARGLTAGKDPVCRNESEALETLFADYLLHWCNTFLSKVEAHAVTPFWRTLQRR